MGLLTWRVDPENISGTTRLLRCSLLLFLLFAYKTAFPADYRAEFQFGLNTGDTEVGGENILIAEVSGTDLDSDTGETFGVEFWIDGLSENTTLGIQYMRLTGADYGGSRVDEHVCLFFCGTPDTLDEQFSPEINTLLLNILARDNTGKLFHERLHPYIGVGIGAAWVDADGVIIRHSVSGDTIFRGSDSDVFVALQGMIGMDYDITRNIYLGLNASYFLTSVTLFHEDHTFEKFIGMATLGYKF